jgi:hypothetical protein
MTKKKGSLSPRFQILQTTPTQTPACFLRRAITPISPKPASSIAHVSASGTAATSPGRTGKGHFYK